MNILIFNGEDINQCLINYSVSIFGIFITYKSK